MPRIPQGEFDQSISQRVGSPDLRMQPSGNSEIVKQVAGLTNVMAQLQDQAERTDAYSYANQVKTNHLQRKAQYSAALESVNGSGMTDYIDPTDNNPDLAKRKRIQRPITEMYQEMVQGYEEDKKGVQKLQRADIGDELTRQYVGDDLIEINLKTNKYLNKVRTKETTERVTENMELHLSNFETRQYNQMRIQN